MQNEVLTAASTPYRTRLGKASTPRDGTVRRTRLPTPGYVVYQSSQGQTLPVVESTAMTTVYIVTFARSPLHLGWRLWPPGNLFWAYGRRVLDLTFPKRSTNKTCLRLHPTSGPTSSPLYCTIQTLTFRPHFDALGIDIPCVRVTYGCDNATTIGTLGYSPPPPPSPRTS